MKPGGKQEPTSRHELERILSKHGLCSRTQASVLVRAGRVRVNGVVILDPLAWFDGARDRIEVDGQRLGERALRYVVLHKPRGSVTTRKDPDGRPTVYDLLGDVGAWVVTVGRLDLETSGLLLFTNDTHFAEHVTSPASHVPKCYRVEATPRLAEAAYESLRAGVVLHDGPTRPALVEPIGDRGPKSLFHITISEGRNRQVRRMVRAVGAKVVKLARVAIGPLELGDLASGAWRDLTAAEVRALAGPSRGPRSPKRR